jgi:plasmid maintenance system killer protein
MWTILETGAAVKQLESAPVQVKKKYQFWKSIVAVSGPTGLRNLHGFHDEGLSGKLTGKRSSRLNIHYRVIYEVYQDQVTVTVVSIDPHTYR